jgi:hypothetical protein
MCFPIHFLLYVYSACHTLKPFHSAQIILCIHLIATIFVFIAIICVQTRPLLTASNHLGVPPSLVVVTYFQCHHHFIFHILCPRSITIYLTFSRILLYSLMPCFVHPQYFLFNPSLVRFPLPTLDPSACFHKSNKLLANTTYRKASSVSVKLLRADDKT